MSYDTSDIALENYQKEQSEIEEYQYYKEHFGGQRIEDLSFGIKAAYHEHWDRFLLEMQCATSFGSSGGLPENLARFFISFRMIEFMQAAFRKATVDSLLKSFSESWFGDINIGNERNVYTGALIYALTDLAIENIFTLSHRTNKCEKFIKKHAAIRNKCAHELYYPTFLEAHVCLLDTVEIYNDFENTLRPEAPHLF